MPIEIYKLENGNPLRLTKQEKISNLFLCMRLPMNDITFIFKLSLSFK